MFLTIVVSVVVIGFVLDILVPRSRSTMVQGGPGIPEDLEETMSAQHEYLDFISDGTNHWSPDNALYSSWEESMYEDIGSTVDRDY